MAHCMALSLLLYVMHNIAPCTMLCNSWMMDFSKMMSDFFFIDVSFSPFLSLLVSLLLYCIRNQNITSVIMLSGYLRSQVLHALMSWMIHCSYFQILMSWQRKSNHDVKTLSLNSWAKHYFLVACVYLIWGSRIRIFKY